MDEQNGEVFDHHAELFSQIGAVSDHEPFKDFMLDSGGLLDATPVTTKPNSLPLSESGGTSQGSMWSQSYEPAPLLLNHNRTMYSSSIPVPPLDDVDNASALIDSLVKNLPSSDGILDQFPSQHFMEKGSNSRANIMGHFGHAPGQLFEGLHRISTDRVTQDMLDNLSRLEANDLLGKCNEFENLAWNRVVGEPVHNMNVQAQNRLIMHPQSSVDKNGNTAMFNNSHGDKVQCGFPLNSIEHAPQSNSLIRLSPSASLESNVHTPTTSYESASPLSSNRTPIRSDESISPMGSGHTPLRMDDSTSPLAGVKTPMRIDEGSPVGRTPLRVEEGYSPAGVGGTLPARVDGSPSHKLNGQTPQRFENYSSPPGAVRKGEAKSPISNVLPSPRTDSSENGKAADPREGAAPAREGEEKGSGPGAEAPEEEGSVCQHEKRKKWREKSTSECDFPGRDAKGAAPPLGAEAPAKKQGLKRVPIPLVSAKQLGDSALSKKAAKRTLPRKSDSELYLASSSLPRRSEAESESLVANEFDGIKTENRVPDSKKDTLSDNAQISENADPAITCEENLAKSRKRRKNSDALGAPSAKKRFRKKVTIYQSSVSPEETGIKLKIKLASSFPSAKPLKKRRSKRQYLSDDEDSNSASRKCKKSVRFSSGTKESESSQQTKWGSEIPPDILQKVFKFVIEEQGCVPSLVRFSSVCKLWNLVASRSELWQNIDLSSPYIKQKCRIDRYFRWLLENRLESIQELNLNGWKFSNITMILSLIGTHCTEIESIGLAGWQGLHYEHVKSLLQDCPRLAKLDLSDVSPESKSANSAVSQKSITYLTQTMGERLTQLILAHNTLTCLPQIISSLATHCPNLQVLDLSNIRRVSHTEFALNIEHLQEGCQKLKVLRITNSCITLANVPLEKQVASPGFTNLEELSIAGHQGTESLRITSVMDDSCLERILKKSHKLKLLDVRGCTRITDSSLVRVPAWDIQHLFLSGCYVTRQSGSGLELIAQKWSHSLMEIDLAWTTVTEDLNAAVMAFAEKGSESPLRIMNLCGSSVTLEPVKAILTKCPNLESLNLQSCRGLPRGVKRLYENEQLIELRNMLDKKGRDSVSEGEDRRDADREGRESPGRSTNSMNDDLDT